VSREGETGLGRWARLKAEARAADRVVEAEPEPAPPVPIEAPAPEAQETEESKPVELPPIESLTKDSDFSSFMRGGVSDDSRKAALRKLWSLDGHFAQIDITEAFSADFNAVPTFPDGLKNTIYRLGSGMVEAVEEIERQEREAAEKAKALAAQAESPQSESDDPQPPADDAPPRAKA
jgi:Protein of unknown function (DUF3306)